MNEVMYISHKTLIILTWLRGEYLTGVVYIATVGVMEQVDLTTMLTTEDPEPRYVVDRLYYQGQILVVAGEPGVGKSFFQYYIGMCVALGIPMLGLPTFQGVVLYFDEENSHPDMAQYLRWIWRGMGRPNIDTLQKNLHIEHFGLARHPEKRYAYMADCANQVKPSLIIIDTVNPACALTDENDNAEASRAIQQLRLVKEVAGSQATLVLIKHAKFSHDPLDRQTIRGAKTWLGEVDGVIYHKALSGKPRSDGLRNSRLLADKVRAYGLRTELNITPSWTGDGLEKGIQLK